jgi:hypothetical protein
MNNIYIYMGETIEKEDTKEYRKEMKREEMR